MSGKKKRKGLSHGKPRPRVSTAKRKRRDRPQPPAFAVPEFDAIQHPAKRAFLRAYCVQGNVTESARIALMERTSHYLWMDADPEYAAAFAEAQDVYRDYLRSLIRFRALYNDIVLIFEAKKHMPEYRERVGLEHSGRIDSELSLRDEAERIRKLTAEERAALRALVTKMEAVALGPRALEAVPPGGA